MQVSEILPTTDHLPLGSLGLGSNLDCDEFAGKHVSLKHMLTEGVMVFVRMLQPTSLWQAPSVPYHVEFIGCDTDGMHQFRLNAVKPRYGHEPSPVVLKSDGYEEHTRAHSTGAAALSICLLCSKVRKDNNQRGRLNSVLREY